MQTWFPQSGTESIVASDDTIDVVKVDYPLLLPDGRKARFWRIIIE